MIEETKHPEFKDCKKCGKKLHHSLFYKSKSYHNGIDAKCKKCKISQNTEIGRRPEARKKRSEAASRKWREDEEYRARLQRYQKIYRDRPGVLQRYRELQLSYVRSNPEKYRETSRKTYHRNKARPEKICASRIRSQIYDALRGKAKKGKMFDFLGYSPGELKRHIEKQFQKGMTWDNHGEWHIDHIVPLSSFSISGWDDPELKAAWSLTNLRPLWANENIRKHARRTHLI